ncbi:uncharacterized protein LOC144333812 [Macaca mulatta]
MGPCEADAACTQRSVGRLGLRPVLSPPDHGASSPTCWVPSSLRPVCRVPVSSPDSRLLPSTQEAPPLCSPQFLHLSDAVPLRNPLTGQLDAARREGLFTSPVSIARLPSLLASTLTLQLQHQTLGKPAVPESLTAPEQNLQLSQEKDTRGASRSWLLSAPGDNSRKKPSH